MVEALGDCFCDELLEGRDDLAGVVLDGILGEIDGLAELLERLGDPVGVEDMMNECVCK